jgi:hypothetical protein
LLKAESAFITIAIILEPFRSHGSGRFSLPGKRISILRPLEEFLPGAF